MTRTTYFPNLNTLRLYAALSVVVYHLGNVNVDWGFSDTYPGIAIFVSRFFMRGADAVTLFFVLSGFLITYLLLVERERTSTIAVRKFYVRRALRLYPVYYLVVFASYFLLPLLGRASYPMPDTSVGTIALVLLFCAHIPFVLTDLMLLDHLWSLAVEEHFYLLLPPLLKLGRLLLRVVVAYLVVKTALFVALNLLYPDDPPEKVRVLLDFMYYARFECMIIGGFGAYLVFHRHSLLRFVYHPLVERAALVIVLFTVVTSFGPETVGDLPFAVFMSVVFLVVILNAATNPRALLRLEHPVLSAAGRHLSYGIYALHMGVLYVLLYLLHRTAVSGLAYELILYTGGVTLTLAAALLSYRLIERPCLRLKEQFAAESAPPAAVPASQPVA